MEDIQKTTGPQQHWMPKKDRKTSRLQWMEPVKNNETRELNYTREEVEMTQDPERQVNGCSWRRSRWSLMRK